MKKRNIVNGSMKTGEIHTRILKAGLKPEKKVDAHIDVGGGVPAREVKPERKVGKIDITPAMEAF